MSRKHRTPPSLNKTINSQRFRAALDVFDRFIIVKIEGNSNEQISGIRKDFGTNATLVMSKRSCILAGLSSYIEQNLDNEATQYKIQMLETLPKFLDGNFGIILTNMSIEQVDMILHRHVIYKTPIPGKKSSADIVIKQGKTGIEPQFVSFFQSLNVDVKVYRGQVEVQKDFVLCKTGEIVSIALCKLLELLKMKPEPCVVEMLQIFEPGLTYAVQEMMPLVESRVEEAVYEFLCFGLGAGVFTYIEKFPEIESSESESSSESEEDDMWDLFG
jgi:large subunit ribosomal protein LP0